MFRKQLKKLANDADLVTDLAYDHGKNAYGRGKSLLSLASRHTHLAAKEARESAIANHIITTLPLLQSQLSSLHSNLRKNWGKTYSTLGTAVCASEHMFLKLTLGYLVIKWFQNYDKDVKTMANEIKAHVIEKPITSIVIVLGVGYALGMLRK